MWEVKVGSCRKGTRIRGALAKSSLGGWRGWSRERRLESG